MEPLLPALPAPELPPPPPRVPRPPAGGAADPERAASPPLLGDEEDPLPFTSEGSLPFALAADRAENPALSSLLYCDPPPPAPAPPPALRPAEPFEKMPLEKKLFFLPVAATFAPAAAPSPRGVWMSVLINASSAVGNGDACLPPPPPDDASPAAETPVVASAASADDAVLPPEVAVVVEVDVAAESPPPEALSWEEVLLRRDEGAPDGDAVPVSASWPPVLPPSS